jgi:hypothetical protein
MVSSRSVFLLVMVVCLAGCGAGGGGPGAPAKHELKVIVSGAGSVASSPDQEILGCTSSGGTCTANYPPGTVVTLTATTAPSSVFVQWAGDCSPDPSVATQCAVKMTGDEQVIAVFNPSASGGFGDLFALTDNNALASFNRSAPGNLTSSTAISGLTPGDRVIGIDFRPSDGLLYGLAKSSSGTGRLYLINKISASATLVSTLNATLSGETFDIDFDPVRDRLTAIGGTQVLDVNPKTGSASSVQFGSDGGLLGGIAYNNDFSGTATTTLYAINASAGRLKKAASAAWSSVGLLGQNIGPVNSLDIEPTTETAYVAYNSSTGPQLATVDLATGAASSPVQLGGVSNVIGLAVAIPAAPEVFGIRTDLNQAGAVTRQTLVKFAPLTPDKLTSEIGIPGMGVAGTGGGSAILAVAFGPPNQTLYALVKDSTNSSGSLATLNPETGATTNVGSVGPLSARLYGMSFDTAGMIHVVGSDNKAFQVDPGTASSSAPSTLQRIPIQPTGIAFTNDLTTTQQSGGSTTFYAIDAATDRLGTINLNNAPMGRFNPIGGLGLSASQPEQTLSGFKIIGTTGSTGTTTTPKDQVALAAFSSSFDSILYWIDLDTGGAIPIGQIGYGKPVISISAMPNPTPSSVPFNVYAVTTDTHVIAFSRGNPGGAPALNCSITGLNAGETILAMDIMPHTATPAMPQTGILYVLTDDAATSDSRLVQVTINSTTNQCSVPGAATGKLIAAPCAAVCPPSLYNYSDLKGRRVGLAFNPVTSTFHVTTDQAKHLEVDPNTFIVTEDTAISNGSIELGALSFTNSVGTTAAVPYYLNLDAAQTQAVPTVMVPDGSSATDLRDLGNMFTNGTVIENNTASNYPTPPAASLDIFGSNNSLALAVLKAKNSQGVTESFTRLYRVDLSSGALMQIIDASCDPSKTSCGGIGPYPPLVPSCSSPSCNPQESRINVTSVAVRFPAIQ